MASTKQRKGTRKGRQRKTPVPKKVRDEILAAIASGRTGVEVSKQYGVANSTISGWKKKEARSEKASRASPRVEPAEGDEAPVAESRETGRYNQKFKEEVLKQVFSGRKIVEVARQYAVTERSVNRWLRAWEDSGGKLPEAKGTRPQSTGRSPIDEEHRALVLSLKSKHPNMGLAQLQNQLKRFHVLKLSRKTIGRIFFEAGIPLEKRSRKAESDASKNRFEMTRPGELWAVDFKDFWVHSEKAHALFLLDDFSRFCVGFSLARKPTADLAIETVESAIQRYGRPERILSDRGSQFHAWNGVSQFDRFLAEFLIDHSVTKANHPFTNGKIEAFNRSLETELLDVEELASLKEAEEKIRQHINRYNFCRTHMGIEALVPADRFFGMVAEARRALAEGLKKAGPGLRWLKGLVSEDGVALRQPSVLQLVLGQEKLELVMLGRRFTLGK